MTSQWIELNSELYALEMTRAKKRPRYNPGRLYQGNAKLTTAIGKLLRWWRQ